MKRLVPLIFLLCFGISNAQSIDVDPPGEPESSFSLEQLAEDVLIGTVDCATVNNFSSASGLPTVKSFGYFEYTGTDLPFDEGIILSTGLGTESEGPNDDGSITSGGAAWVGDTDMQAILDDQLGGTIITNDATSVQFDFIPNTTEINFNYIFASEEWLSEAGGGGGIGNNECPANVVQDGFAFLIQGPGITPDPIFAAGPNQWKNIALLPGTSIPVSVGTIYSNPNCTPPMSNETFQVRYSPLGSAAAQ